MRAAAALLGLLALAAAGSAVAESILFIGNSFTYGEHSPVQHFAPETVRDLNHHGVGGVPALFKAFADEAGLRYEVSLETAASMGLDFHYEDKRDVITGRWDHVVLQGYSTLDAQAPGNPAKLIDYAGRLADLFHERNPQVDVRLVATWSRADQTYLPGGHWYGRPIEAMALDIRRACDQAAATSGRVRGVIPVGEAWLEAMHSGIALADPYHPGSSARIDLWAPDNYHASTEGYYLEALVIFATVTGRSPAALGPGERAAATLGIAPDTVLALEQAAARTLAAEHAPAHRASSPE